MVFSSFTFLICFLPGYMLGYFLAPSSWKNAVLFAGSMVFYGYGVKDHPVYLLLMLATASANWLAARCMGRSRTPEGRKRWLLCGLTWNLGCLFLFKYYNFLYALLPTTSS